MIGRRFIYAFMIVCLFACDQKKENVIQNKRQEIKILRDSVKNISYAEFITFWDEFKNALLQNNTSQLSLLIDDDFNGFCSPNLDVSSICKISFQKDSTFTRHRFIEEFYINLNPVYIELLIRCEEHWMNSHVRKTIDSKQRDRCFQTVDKSTFYVDLNIDQDIINLPSNVSLLCSLWPGDAFRASRAQTLASISQTSKFVPSGVKAQRTTSIRSRRVLRHPH